MDLEVLFLNQPILLLVYIVSVTLLFGNLFFLIQLYNQNIKTQKRLREIDKKAIKIKEEADGQAREVLSKTLDKVKSVLMESRYLKQDLINDLDKNIRQVIQKEVGDLDKQSDQALLSIQQVAKSEIENLQEALQMKVLNSQDQVDKEIKEELSRVKKVIESYKEHKLKQVDDEVNKIILEVSEEVLGKALSSNQHQEIVMEALEKAKKAHFFD